MNIIKTSGAFTMAEMYRLTKSPEIAKLSTVKGQVLDIERFIVYEDNSKADDEAVVIAAFETAQGELFATNSRTFTNDFLDIVTMCEETGAEMPKQVKVLEKVGKISLAYIQCVYIS